MIYDSYFKSHRNTTLTFPQNDTPVWLRINSLFIVFYVVRLNDILRKQWLIWLSVLSGNVFEEGLVINYSIKPLSSLILIWSILWPRLPWNLAEMSLHLITKYVHCDFDVTGSYVPKRRQRLSSLFLSWQGPHIAKPLPRNTEDLRDDPTMWRITTTRKLAEFVSYPRFSWREGR